MDYGEPIELDLTRRCWIYRLWGTPDRGGDICLYIGQTTAIHPSRRIQDHQRQVWWNRVTRADYFEVYDAANLGVIEKEQIRDLDPIFNVAGRPGYSPFAYREMPPIVRKLRSLSEEDIATLAQIFRKT